MSDKVVPGSKQASIRGKRAASRIDRLTEKQKAGKSHGNERALVRVGKGNTRILTGAEDLSEWDDEELRYGRRRDKNEAFSGAPPKIVPKALHDEMVRRTLSKAETLMRENLVVAVEALTEIVKGQDVEEKDRLRAIGMIMDRVMGKPKDTVEITGEAAPWQVAVNAGIVRIDAAALGGTPDDEGDEDSDED